MKKIVIIGGGVAGMASAVFLADKGFEITLYEASPKLGGRCYSFSVKSKNLMIDNGKHLIAGWYKNFIDFLKITDSYGNFTFQKEFNVKYLNLNGKISSVRFSSVRIKNFMYLISSGYFSLKDLLAFNKFLKFIVKQSDYNIQEKEISNSMELLIQFGFSKKAIKYFWTPVTVSIFNVLPEKVYPKIFVELFRRGFSGKQNIMLGFPEKDFFNAYIDKTVKYLEKKNVRIYKSSKVKIKRITDNRVDCITVFDNDIYADYYILTVPFFMYEKVLPERYYNESYKHLMKMETSSIINVHLFFKNRIPEVFKDFKGRMLGFHNDYIQWIFVNSDKYLNISVSNASNIRYKNSVFSELSSNMIFDIVLNNLKLYIKNLEENEISDYYVVKEKRATCIPDKESFILRNINTKLLYNLYIAGDWTYRLLPSTLESAALSAKICSEELTNLSNKSF